MATAVGIDPEQDVIGAAAAGAGDERDAGNRKQDDPADRRGAEGEGSDDRGWGDDEGAQGAVEAAHVLNEKLAGHDWLLPVIECFRLEGRECRAGRYTLAAQISSSAQPTA